MDYRNQGGTASDSDLVPFGMRSFILKTFVPDKGVKKGENDERKTGTD